MAKRKVATQSISSKALSSYEPIERLTVDYMRPELAILLPQYRLIRDSIAGEPVIKGMTGVMIPVATQTFIPLSIESINLLAAKRYLPQPNATDTSSENQERYRAYVGRAVWYPVTGRTLNGLAGEVFLRDPVVELPPELEGLITDANGNGLSLDETADAAIRYCISYGRTGVLVDFPITNGQITQKQIDDRDIQPTLTVYDPEHIRNWRTKKINGQYYLTLVVLYECIDAENDEYALTQIEQYRVLRLTDTGVTVQVFQKNKSGYNPGEVIYPKDAQGKPLDEIPFKFVGAQNNEPRPNQPPLYDIASLNIAHYRNSADYEESCFMVGQPTPVITGVDEFWAKQVWKGQIFLGSRVAIPLPANGKAELLQAQPNSMPFEAMTHKEQQMVALGAKLIQDNSVAKTATQDIIDTNAEASPLALISKNVTAVILWALGVAAAFVGANPKKVKYELNKDFDSTSMTADDQNALIKMWQGGAISYPEMRVKLRRAGIATTTDEAARTATQKDIKDGMIPDPALASKALDAKSASSAGGPQPDKRNQPAPTGT